MLTQTRTNHTVTPLDTTRAYHTFSGHGTPPDYIALSAPDSGKHSGNYDAPIYSAAQMLTLLQQYALALSTLTLGGELQLSIPYNGQLHTIAHVKADPANTFYAAYALNDSDDLTYIGTDEAGDPFFTICPDNTDSAGIPILPSNPVPLSDDMPVNILLSDLHAIIESVQAQHAI